MKPIKLSMTAFGPFINTEVIDFEALGENPLFLINGTTGSGKTTILDAICFALYGQTTGKEREAMQMRCDFAPDDLLTEVEFLFELGGEFYRIKRVPEQLRAKSKGDGTTKQVASAELYRLDNADLQNTLNEHLLVAKKVSDATQVIEDLTGLQVDQFRQVMVLPQGQFRQLLMADSKDREKIFSQLFETHVYKRIEDKLRAQASIVSKKVQDLKENQKGILLNVGIENSEELELAIEKIKPESDALKASLALKSTAYLESLKTFENAKELEQSFDDLHKQKQSLESLKLQEDEIKKKKEQLSLAMVAEKITPVFDSLTKSTSSFEEASKLLTNLEERHKNALDRLKIAEEDVLKNPKRQIELDDKKAKAITLKSYQQKGEELEQKLDSLKASQESFDKVEQQSKEAQVSLNNLLENQASAEKDKLSLDGLIKEEGELKVHLQVLSDQISKRQNYEELEKKIVVLKQEIENITKKGKDLKKQLDDEEQYSKSLDLKWHQAQAAILAKDLENDHACPVCGSLEHPSPATSSEDYPSNEEREAAQQAINVTREKYLKARESYSNFVSRQGSLKDQVEDLKKQWNDINDVSLIDLQKENETLKQRLGQHEIQQKQLAGLVEKLSQLKNKEDEERKGLELLHTSKSELNAKLQAAKALVETAEQALPEEYRQLSNLHKAISEVDGKIDALEKSIIQSQQHKDKASNDRTEAETNLNNQKKAIVKLKEELEKAQASWQIALDKSDFQNEVSYQQAHSDDTVIIELKSVIEEFDKEFQKLNAVIENQQLSLKDKIKPDISLLQTQLESAEKEKSLLEEDYKKKDEELSHFIKAQQTLLDIKKNQQAEEDEYKIIGTLSNVANGNTGNKISLQRFVLSVLLDDVLIDASLRLKIMSKGRYKLLRKENRAKGNKASGLELEVEDSYTGKIRPVSTLSGGESFMASLSLALGLSDVVQAYAGGIHLDTLFIDEGFGSLDADSLDLAIRTLMDLRDTGRMVGIISHVSELKEQIPLRIDVKSRMDGSYIELVN